MSQPVIVYLALGSNLGDRAANLARARQALAEFISEFTCSDIYETSPWGVLEQPNFLNQVIKGNTSLTPLKLLDRLKSIEGTLGREETIRFGPRIIDLDILLYGNRVLHHRRLQVPHPRMTERAFVLVPLAELAPGLVLPGAGIPVESLLAAIDNSGVVRYAPADPDC